MPTGRDTARDTAVDLDSDSTSDIEDTGDTGSVDPVMGTQIAPNSGMGRVRTRSARGWVVVGGLAAPKRLEMRNSRAQLVLGALH